MNIFAVHDDPQVAAISLPDKLVVKMPTESAQMLAQWFFFNTGKFLPKLNGEPYKITKSLTNNPCTQWLFEDDANVVWLLVHSMRLSVEYERRYRREHGTRRTLLIAHDLFRKTELKKSFKDHTPFVQNFDDEFKIPDCPVAAYRWYMRTRKNHYANWTYPGVKPSWWW